LENSQSQEPATYLTSIAKIGFAGLHQFRNTGEIVEQEGERKRKGEEKTDASLVSMHQGRVNATTLSKN